MVNYCALVEADGAGKAGRVEPLFAFFKELTSLL